MGIRGGAGGLKHLVRIQVLTTAVDANGYEVPAYADRGEEWAKIMPLKESERTETHQNKGFTSHQITMRYNADIAGADRIVFGSRKFDIEGVTNRDEASVETVAVCVEVD